MTPRAFLFCVLLPACARGRASSDSNTTRDSAGITIVESKRPLWASGDQIKLAASPALVVGSQDAGDPYLFRNIKDVTRMTDGRIVVADGAGNSIRLFDSTGKYLKTIARAGKGPGEFSYIQSLQRLAGDTLAVNADNAFTFFTGAGQFVEKVDARDAVKSFPTKGQLMPTAVFADHSMIVGTWELALKAPPGAGRTWVDSFPLYVTDRSGANLRPIGWFPNYEWTNGKYGPGGASAGAKGAYAVRGQTLYVGIGTEYSIYVRSSTGRLERIIRRTWTPNPMTTAAIDSYIRLQVKREVASMGKLRQTEEHERLLRENPFADNLPVFSQLIVDASGNLWVRSGNIADAPWLEWIPQATSSWSVFDSTGRWLGDVGMPAFFQAREIGADYVLGISVDEEGVEAVAMYRLEGGSKP
jgi:hypothetical protein